MILYLAIIFCAMLAIACATSGYSGDGFGRVFMVTALSTLSVIAVDGITAGIARLLPKSVADYTKKIYKVTAKEKKFYERLKIRDWKEKIPELVHLTGFRKNKIADPKNIEYVERFLLEICYGDLGHFASLFSGFTILLFYPVSRIWIIISIPVAIVNFLLNLPFLCVLRYNSYKLEILRKRYAKK